MKVFLIRHGDAEAEVPDALDDDARSLTPRAREALPGHFAGLASYFGRVDAILTSPLMRAVQTATLLAHSLKYAGQLKAHRSLFPDGPVGGLEALLEQYPGRTLVLVGHQPSIGAAAAYLIGRAALSKPVSPGTVVGIERADTAPDPLTSTLLCFAQVGQPVLEAL